MTELEKISVVVGMCALTIVCVGLSYAMISIMVENSWPMLIIIMLVMFFAQSNRRPWRPFSSPPDDEEWQQ